MSRRALPCLLLLGLLLSFPTLATEHAALAVSPDLPTTADVVEVTLTQAGGDCTLEPGGVEVAGGVVTVRDLLCGAATGVPSFVVGPLAAGTYQVETLQGGVPTPVGAFTVTEGGEPFQLGTGPVIRSIPGQDLFEVSLLDVPGIRFCAPREIFVDRVDHAGSVARVLLAERLFDSFCAGPSLPGDVDVALSRTYGDRFTSVAVRYAPADPAAGIVDLGTVQISHGDACPDDALCLSDGRFRVQATWTTADDTGTAAPVPLTGDSGAFWFFRPDNLELTVKVLDGCAAFDRYWVFISGLTDQGVEIRVHDTESDQTRLYTNDLGQGFEAIRDTDAFATCP